MQSLIGGAQQDGSAVRAALWLIKLHDHRARKDTREQNSLCYILLVQQKPPLGRKVASTTALYHERGFSCLVFVNYPGCEVARPRAMWEEPTLTAIRGWPNSEALVANAVVSSFTSARRTRKPRNYKRT